MPYQLPHLLIQCSYCLESSMRGLHPCFQLIVLLIFEISLTTRLLNFHFHLHCLRRAIGCRLFPALKMTQEICNSVVISLHFLRILRSLFNINTLMFPKIWLTEVHIIAFNMYIHVLVPVYITFLSTIGQFSVSNLAFPPIRWPSSNKIYYIFGSCRVVITCTFGCNVLREFI